MDSQKQNDRNRSMFNHLAKKKEINHDGKSLFPIEILREIIEVLIKHKYVAKLPNGIDTYSGKELEKLIEIVMTKDYYVWSSALQTQCKEVALGEKIYSYLLPKIDTQHKMLSSDFILHALKPYEMDPDCSFAFFGPMEPKDTFQWTDFKKEFPIVRHYGFILNTVRSEKINQGFVGSHWVAFHIDTNPKNPIVEFFDSLGNKPNELVIKCFSSIFNMMKKNYFDYLPQNIWFTEERNQKSSTECGVYVTHFLITRITGKSYVDFLSSDLSDHAMHQLRKEYWN